MTDKVSCIDISHWQGFPDFDQLYASGVVACIHKATEGTSYVDPNRATNWVNATDAGIACSTYHWLKPGNAANQMDFYLSTLDPVKGERVVIDYEEDGCSLNDLEAAVDYLINDAKELKLQVTVYSGHLLKEQLGSDHNEFLADNTDLWIAQYTDASQPSWPTGTYKNWTLWQYSETGVLPGIDDTNVDLNRFDGTDAELVKWISASGKPPPKPPKPPTPANETVAVVIQSSQGVDVSVIVNGTEQAKTSRLSRRRMHIPRRPDLI
jgi:lysozyme